MDEFVWTEQMKVIEKVKKPTYWCSPRIVVNIEVHLALMREFNAILSTEDALSEISHNSILSKIDAKLWYWKMPLSNERKKKLLRKKTEHIQYYSE